MPWSCMAATSRVSWATLPLAVVGDHQSLPGVVETGRVGEQVEDLFQFGDSGFALRRRPTETVDSSGASGHDPELVQVLGHNNNVLTRQLEVADSAEDNWSRFVVRLQKTQQGVGIDEHHSCASSRSR